MNLLGARGGAKQARGAVQPVIFGTGGKGGVLGVRIGCGLKGRQKILNGDCVFRGDCWHEIFPDSVQEPTSVRRDRAVMQVTGLRADLQVVFIGDFSRKSMI